MILKPMYLEKISLLRKNKRQETDVSKKKIQQKQ